MKINNYSLQTAKAESSTLPKSFDVDVKTDLLNQAKRVYEDRSHNGLAIVKTRSEVVRTKKKLYKQKGTGGARHGAKSAHIFVGGGVAHGPKGEKRVLNLSKKMRIVALKMAVKFAFETKKAAILSGVEKVKKTTEAAKGFAKLTKELKISEKAKVLLILNNKNAENKKFFRNIKNLKVSFFANLNAYEVLNAGYVFFDGSVFEAEKKVTKKEAKS